APKDRAVDRSALFQHFEKRASTKDRYFVYQTLLERLQHKGGPPRRPGRPRPGTPGPGPAHGPEVRGREPIRRRDRSGNRWRGRLFSDLHAFLSPVYGSEKSYEQIAKWLPTVFRGEPVLDALSVKRALLRNRRSVLSR